MRSLINKSEIFSGLKRSIPIFLGYIPVGMAFGLLALNAGVTPLLTIVMSTLVLGASSQIIAIQLLNNGVNFWLIIATTLLVNLRHMLMSFYLSNHLKGWRWNEICIFSFGLTDEAFALHSSRIAEGKLLKTEAITINVMSLVSWIFGTYLGVLVGPFLVSNRAISLDFALPAMFIVLLVLLANTPKKLVAAMSAGCVAIAINLMGFAQWSILLATVVVATIGLATDKWKAKN